MEMLQDNNMSFPDVMTRLYNIWEKTEKQQKHLQDEIKMFKTKIDEMTKEHMELSDNFQKLQLTNDKLVCEINELSKKVKDAEDDQQQFRKVSRIITMDRENNNYKQQIAILERRVAFYQNQCNNIKSSNNVIKIDEQTDTDDLLVDNNINDNDPKQLINRNTEGDILTYNDEFIHHKETDIITYNDDFINHKETDNESITVKEKKIKGAVYYISEDKDIYIKNEDGSIGPLKGKLDYLPSGKTKVKWYKS